MMKKIHFFILIGIALLSSILWGLPRLPKPQSIPTSIYVTEKEITIDGKSAKVYAIAQADGTFGYYGQKGQMFDVVVYNQTKVPLVLHWHGIILPNPDDGVPFVTQLPIMPGNSFHYKFPIQQAGTFWFHSHYKLQEQKLMAAPLILHDEKEPKQHEALMFIQDFTFRDPVVIYQELRKKMQQPMSHPMAGMNDNHQNTMKNMSTSNDHQKEMSMPMSDLTDVKFDAYLTNHRTLSDPDVIRVTPHETIRLRIINASASSNYYIDLGQLTGKLIAVDGTAIEPVAGRRFQIAIGNRLDILLTIPASGAFPILALPEGTRQQTGLILATPDSTLPKLPNTTTTMNPALTSDQEFVLHAKTPLVKKPVDTTLVYNLEGDMQTYRWSINGEEWPNVKPFVIHSGQRVALVFNNKSGMSHPMHFHGHVFQIVELNGKAVNGRQGDTVNVMPNQSVIVILDADNPGIWMLHCHILYHQQGGMMTTINYQNYQDPFTLKQRLEGHNLYLKY